MKKNLVLLGMPGSGKSSLGKLLAKITGLKLYDIDKLIIEEIGLEIAEIFQTKGEEFFRKIEEKKTLEILKKSNNIIALGGGAFLNEKIRSKILKNDYSVWLKWDKETLTSRLTKSKKRPITYSLEKNDLIKLIEKRAKIYSLAKFKINCDKLSKQEIAKKILEIYEK